MSCEENYVVRCSFCSGEFELTVSEVDEFETWECRVCMSDIFVDENIIYDPLEYPVYGG